MIWQFPAFAILMHVFAYLFNGTLIVLLMNKRVVSARVYMAHMIISEVFMNLSQTILVEFPYFFPQDPAFYSFPGTKLVEIISQMSYQAKFYMALLMALNRIWVIMKPIGSEVFSAQRLNMYLIAGWIVLFFRQFVILASADCYFKMNLVQFQVMAVCENIEDHQLRMKISSCISYFLHIVIPWMSVTMNIIVFICIRKRKLMSKLPMKSSERALVINSLVVSLILTANYLYNSLYSFLKPTISQQSDAFQSAFSFFNLYGCSCFNFIVYFLLDGTTRKKVLSVFSTRVRTGVSNVATTN